MTATIRAGDWRARVYAWSAARKGPLARRLVLRAARRPDRLERVADLRARAGDVDGAVEALEAAIQTSPGTPTWYVKLGRLLERQGHQQVQRASVGLVLRPGDWEAAARVYARGTRACPQEAELWYRFGRAELHLGRAEVAREAFSRAAAIEPERARHHAQLGRAIHAVYTERGGTLAGEVDQELAAYRKALELDPERDSARERLLETSLRQRRWTEAVAAALGPSVDRRDDWDSLLRRLGAVEREQVAEVLHKRLGDDEAWPVAAVPPRCWYTLHARLIDLDQYLLAYRAKDAFARSILAHDEGHPVRDPIERARALGCLGDLVRARGELDPDLIAGADVDTDLVWKLRADLALFEGETAELLALHDQFVAANHPAGEARFEELITDRDVVIVGPSPPTEDLGELIDAADTVIRPKLLDPESVAEPGPAGTRTDIAYYGSLTSGLVTSEIERLLEAGVLQMAVFRRSRYRPDRRWIRHPGDLRYMPTEFSAMLRAGPFGIHRIVYDVLRYRPASLRVYHADLFTGPTLHRPGYDADQRFIDDGGLARVPLSILAHDYRADHTLAKALHAAGHVRVRPNVEEILRWSPEEYLQVLDRRTCDAA